jgi:hypothetical protein
MATVTRYVWGKTAHGYGWQPWEGCGLTIKREGQSTRWGVYEPDVTRLCVCTSYRGAQRVVARLRRAEQARFNPLGGLDFALLTQTPAGITYAGYSTAPGQLCGSGQTFATQAEADAYLRGCAHVPTQ